MRRYSFLTCLALGCLLASSAQGAEWGDLTMRFVYDGPAPKPVPIDVTKDQQFCGKHNLVDESLVVNPKNNGIANVVVYLYLGRRDAPPAVHESYAKAAAQNISLDNKNCRFEPRVVTVTTADTLVIGNPDPVGHNTKIDTFNPGNPPSNYTVPAGGQLEQKFAEAERLPAAASCSIHPWMKAWLVIKDNPYMAVSDADGNLTIKNLPAGKWTFQLWQEKSGYIDEAKLNGTPSEWRSGRVEIEIKPGANDFGELKVSPALFEK